MTDRNIENDEDIDIDGNIETDKNMETDGNKVSLENLKNYGNIETNRILILLIRVSKISSMLRVSRTYRY